MAAIDWEKRFQEKQTPWRRDTAHPGLQMWLDTGVMQPCRILVPGCGDSLELSLLAFNEFEVTGIDMSKTAIKLQKKLLGSQPAELFKTDMFAWTPDETFDAVYEQTCLCAIEPRQRKAYEAKLYDWLKPGGQLFAQFMQKEMRGGPPFDCSLKSMQKLFDPERWEWTDIMETDTPFHMQGAWEAGRVLVRV